MSTLVTSTVSQAPAQSSPGQTTEGQVDASPGSAVLEAPAASGRDHIAARLRDFGATGVGTLALTAPAPDAAAEDFLDLATLPESFFWQESSGAAHAGHGVVHSLRAAGGDRFGALQRLADEALGGLVSEGIDGVSALEPRLWGGLAFDEGSASSAPWTSFGDAEFFLPRFLYRTTGTSNGSPASTLSLAVTAEEARDDAMLARLLEQFDALLDGLRQRPVDVEPDVLGESHARCDAETDDAAWIRQVEDIRRAIQGGEVEKIVAARRFRVAVRGDLPISGVLRRLGRGLRSSTRFAFRHRTQFGDVTFLGATPERLVSRRGDVLETEALAGTMEAGGEHAAELLESGKNRHEQQLVTDSIVRRLRPLCTHLEVAERPTVRELRDMLHLHTPIRGTLASSQHVLDLVQALHPTPAVGGVPTPEAMHWIAEHESHPRGWYAAPIGWLDGRGDGEFYVALRSCVVAGDEAFLYAGAGIVGDSDPLAELRETELKTHALRKALCF